MQCLLCAADFNVVYRWCETHFQNLVDSAKPLLRKAIQISQQTPYWHCRLLFQLAVCIHACKICVTIGGLVFKSLFTCKLSSGNYFCELVWFLLSFTFFML